MIFYSVYIYSATSSQNSAGKLLFYSWIPGSPPWAPTLLSVGAQGGFPLIKKSVKDQVRLVIVNNG